MLQRVTPCNTPQALFVYIVIDLVAMPRSIDLPGVMLTIIVAGVVAFVGLVVMDEVAGQLGTENFAEAETELIDAIEVFFSMISIVFIVIVLAVVLAYLYAMRGGNAR